MRHERPARVAAPHAALVRAAPDRRRRHARGLGVDVRQVPEGGEHRPRLPGDAAGRGRRQLRPAPRRDARVRRRRARRRGGRQGVRPRALRSLRRGERRRADDGRRAGAEAHRHAVRRAPARDVGPPQARRRLLSGAAMERLKGLILSGGRGTRLRPITHTSAKQLVPVANQPVLFYGIEAMAQAGIRDIGIIIAPETGDEIREAAGDGEQFGVQITYVVQDEPAGLAHAVLTAEPFLGDSPFVMYLGDNLLQGGMDALVREFQAEGPDSLILLTPVPDPENYGVAELDAAGAVKRLVEKPQEPATDLALVGVYMFTSHIHHAARSIQPSARGELEITDAIQWLVDSGRRVEPHIVRGGWKDTGRLDDMLEANRLILETIDRKVDGELEDSQVDGRVVVEPGARLERATVRGPAVIGSGALLRDAYIGPYTAVGAGCVIEKAEVEHSILLEASSVRGLEGRMESSLLGKNVAISRDERQPRAYRFMVGDNSEIGIL